MALYLSLFGISLLPLQLCTLSSLMPGVNIFCRTVFCVLYIHMYLGRTYVNTSYICAYFQHKYVLRTYVLTLCICTYFDICTYFAHMYILRMYVLTWYICKYFVHMYVLPTYVHSSYVCTMYLLCPYVQCAYFAHMYLLCHMYVLGIHTLYLCKYFLHVYHKFFYICPAINNILTVAGISPQGIATMTYPIERLWPSQKNFGGLVIPYPWCKSPAEMSLCTSVYSRIARAWQDFRLCCCTVHYVCTQNNNKKSSCVFNNYFIYA